MRIVKVVIPLLRSDHRWGAISCPDQLCSDAEAIARTADAILRHITDAKRFGDFANVLLFRRCFS
jgi:hypothetical protein